MHSRYQANRLTRLNINTSSAPLIYWPDIGKCMLPADYWYLWNYIQWIETIILCHIASMDLRGTASTYSDTIQCFLYINFGSRGPPQWEQSKPNISAEIIKALEQTLNRDGRGANATCQRWWKTATEEKLQQVAVQAYTVGLRSANKQA